MIYIAIADGLNRLSENNNEKWDCRVMRQPQSLLPEKIIDYINNTSNEGVKKERFFAYTALGLCLKEFFDVSDWNIKRTECGKPYLTDILGDPLLCSTAPKSKLEVSLSHSDGVAVVALSNEGEIGVDIQAEVDQKKAERLDKRFLKDVEPKNDNMNVRYFYLNLGDEKCSITEIFPKISLQSDFLTKWTFAESVIKCFGLTFSDISKVNELSKKVKSQTVLFESYKITTTSAI